MNWTFIWNFFSKGKCYFFDSREFTFVIIFENSNKQNIFLEVV
jgi:hypothetical protein